MMDTFLTTNRRDYVWPYPKPIVAIPQQPPLTTKPRGIYMNRPDIGSCLCDGHDWNPMFRRYLCLTDKEGKLSNELYALKTELALITNDVLEHPSGEHNAKMKTIYQTDYINRGYELKDYSDLVVAVDSKVGAPIPCKTIGFGNGFRDPNLFRYRPLGRPTIDGNQPVTFKVTPTLVSVYNEPFPGRTEYQDGISKMGLASLKSSQQYKEPLPSSRRRFGDPCL